MPWFNVWDGLKTKTCRYLLQRYLGQFLEEKLDLDQLKVELYDGKASVKNVSLKVEALNQLFEAQGWALEVITGHIEVLTVTVPWNALMTNDSSIEVIGLHVSLRPIKRQNDGTSMLESMWSSASSSMQLAEECMKQKDEDNFDGNAENTNPIAGLEKFAETIDNVLNRIKAKFINSVLRLEFPSTENQTGIAVIMKIDELNYKNETGNEKYFNQSFDNSREDLNADNIHLLPNFAKHNIVVNGLQILTEEFKVSQRTKSRCSQTTANHVCNEACFTINCDTTQIPILEIRDQQKIELKMKQSEMINGPKVCLDVELGSIFSFFAPRQIHLLLQLWNAFYEDNTSDMKELNQYMKSRNENANQTIPSHRSHMTGILSNHGNWGDDCDEAAVSTAQQSLFENTYVDHSAPRSHKYCDSLSSSMSSSSTVTGISRFQRKMANMESCGDILKFNVVVGSVIAFILHEDILVECSFNENSNSPLNEKSQLDMLRVANQFFSQSKTENFEADPPLSKWLCERNHLYVRVAPVFANGTQQRNRNMLLMSVSASVTKADVYEILEGAPSPIILFDRIENCPDGYARRPELAMSLKSTSCSLKDISTTKIDITMEKATLELDITMYDRLSSILGPSPFASNKAATSDAYKSEEIPKTPVSVSLTSRLLEVKLRFPIVDARPIHDPLRVPWWKKNIRSDYLLFCFTQFRLKLASTTVDIAANEINAFYCEKSTENMVHLLRTTMAKADGNASNNQTFEYPRITLDFPTYRSLNSFIINQPKSLSDSSDCDMCTNPSEFSLPFSAKRVCRESDTVHNKRDTAESETVLLPGDTAEINEFCKTTMNTSKMQIRINLPIIDVIFESKQLFEIIYNRLNSDLFMWEPSSPLLKSFVHQSGLPMDQSIFNVSLMESMYVPSMSPQDPYESIEEKRFKSRQTKVNENLQSDSDESDGEAGGNNNDSSFSGTDTESIYFSTHAGSRPKPKIGEKKVFSDCAVEIIIGKGALSLFVPVRDTENHVLPEQLGMFDFRLDRLKIFSVNGYNGNNNLCYLCIQLNDIEIYHCGLLPANAPVTLQGVDSKIEQYMQSTFYKVPSGLTKGCNNKNKKREMVGLVIETKKIPEQRIKRLRISTGIQNATLRHHPALSPHIWLNQLIDFLDVLDYPIEGYKPFGIITEIQLHLWECAIDYRPKNFMYRAVVEIGSFTISSNIISAVNGCNLRFILEDCVLSIAPFDCVQSSERYPEHKITCMSSNNLVPVLDIGLFDISLRLSDQAKNCPKLDLRCSMHDVHLRTCSDSGNALAKLIGYIAKDGDVTGYNNDEDECSSSLQSSIYSDAEIISNRESTSSTEVSQEQQERVNLLMAEAVRETVISTDSHSEVRTETRGTEVFYFPDESSNKGANKANPNLKHSESSNELCDIINFESNVITSYYTKPEEEETLPQIKADLGDVGSQQKASTAKEFSTQDDDFYIIGGERKFLSHCGIKNIKVSDDPIRIVDNHFMVPTGKPDLLKSPDNFPVAVYRYTLCEMTFTWHMYGGKDFPDNSNTTDSKQVKKEHSRMSEAYKHGVSYSKGTQALQYINKPKEKLTWKTIGGQQRNHEVLVEMQFLKVRFSHEVYPTHTSQASRQVLLINEIEVRDRLQTSEINKFLYYPNMKNLPNKTMKPVVIIKALHVRPNPKRSTAKECSLFISLTPIRLHIDQDTLIFMADYFTSIADNDAEREVDETKTKKPCQPPIMTVDEVPEAVQDLQARRLVATNLDLLMDGENTKNDSEASTPSNPVTNDESAPIFFREIKFSPEVSICLDYHGRRVEMSRGPVAGLLMGLGQLQCSEIRLREVEYKRGILGLDKLVTFLCKEWLKDIKRNQLPKILSGVGPTYAFLQFFQGIYDLFWLPIEQYQKDGRIIRGLQLGAQSFTARTALAALEITSRVIQLLQFTAETAFDMVSPGPSVRKTRKMRKGKKKRPHRPKDIREGVTNAYMIVKEGINDSANTLIETAVAEHDQKGYTGAVGAVMRQIPQLVVCPAVLATQATTNILGGVKSSLVPDAKREAREKWKDDSD